MVHSQRQDRQVSVGPPWPGSQVNRSISQKILGGFDETQKEAENHIPHHFTMSFFWGCLATSVIADYLFGVAICIITIAYIYI